MWDRLKTAASENLKPSEERGAEDVAAQPASPAPPAAPASVHRQVAYDNRKQMEQLLPYIRPHETLLAVFDMRGGGTGFLGITSKRLIVYDKAFFGKRTAMVTIPFNKVSRIASEDDAGGMFSLNTFRSSKLVVWAGSESYEFEFRGIDKAHRAYELMVDAVI